MLDCRESLPEKSNFWAKKVLASVSPPLLWLSGSSLISYPGEKFKSGRANLGIVAGGSSGKDRLRRGDVPGPDEGGAEIENSSREPGVDFHGPAKLHDRFRSPSCSFQHIAQKIERPRVPRLDA